MEISILCTDPEHPVIQRLQTWISSMSSIGHSVSLMHDKKDLQGGDILFLVSCGQLIGDVSRNLFTNTLVLHASDLPQGRGWSPYIWTILEGAKSITVSLLDAKDPVDTGAVWLKEVFNLEGHELLPEINEMLFTVELSLMTKAVAKIKDIVPLEQSGDSGRYLQKRGPEDSRLDPHKTIAEQFDLLRVVDSKRFPAFIDYRGKRYLIKIEKDENNQ
jgi:methionyl-tRNA formyltransferase